MPNAEYYVKLMIGDAVLNAAMARAEVDTQREKVAELEARLVKAEQKDPPRE